MAILGGLLRKLSGGGRATILRRAPGEITFAVDPVIPATGSLPVQDGSAHIARRLEGGVLASSLAPDQTVVEAVDWQHSLVAAVRRAYADHRPLSLSPDAIWLTIAQGFAHHVALHSETLRDRLVLHTGKERLTAVSWELITPEQWAVAIDDLADLIDARSSADASRLLVCDFSTTTPPIRTASQIVLMEAFRQYFEYEVVLICGIPQITLQGTPEDWRSVQYRVDRLSEFGLDWWTARLRPICDALVQTAEGQPPLAFWQSIYNSPYGTCAGESINGWITHLFPYLLDKDTRAPIWRNPILDDPDDPRNSVLERSLPPGLSFAPFRLIRLLDGSTWDLEMVGGFLGVAEKRIEENEDQAGALEPIIGWAVRPGDGCSALLDSVLERAEKPLAAPASAEEIREIACRHNLLFEGLPMEFARLLERTRELTLTFESGGKLRLGVQERPDICLRLADGENNPIIPIGETEDGRILACLHSGILQERDSLSAEDWWVLVGKPHREQNEEICLAEEMTVVARGLTPFFTSLLASPDRLFFDAPDFVREPVSGLL